ncbi:MAG TPA: polysaccharide deacetylase family protein [Dokdonella sp.]
MSAPAAPAARRLCIALHDVAPATWPRCVRLLDRLDALGAPPLTLLVVPDYHRRGRADADAAFVRAIDRRLARGDEVALHGYFHLDDAAPPRTPRQWLLRRRLTAGEGEFAALDERTAAARIDAGLAMLGRLGWHPHGFVAPAWLLGAGARAALATAPLRYTSTHTQLVPLDGAPPVAAPCIGASARSAWRRRASRAGLALAGAATRNAPLLRVALHPADAEHADLLAAWSAVLAALLDARQATTKAAANAATAPRPAPAARCAA